MAMMELSIEFMLAVGVVSVREKREERKICGRSSTPKRRPKAFYMQIFLLLQEEVFIFNDAFG